MQLKGFWTRVLFAQAVGDDVLDDCVQLAHVAGSEVELCSGLVESFGSLDADTCGAACDHDGLAMELANGIAVFDDLHGGWTGIAGAFGVLVDVGVWLVGVLWFLRHCSVACVCVGWMLRCRVESKEV